MRTPVQGHWCWFITMLLLILPLAGCGGGSSCPPAVLPPDTTPPTVWASPDSGVYPADQAVLLHSSDNRDPSPVIRYTTDLSEPGETSTVYSGTPIPSPDGTVIKFYAEDASGNSSSVAVEGYTIAAPGTTRAQWGESGHGALSHEPWRHWDEDGEVRTSCAKCHSAEGFLDYAKDGTVDAAAPLPLGLDCSACHASFIPGTIYTDPATYTALEPVEFPSGQTASLFGPSNLCMTCHQGRASTVQVESAAPNDIIQEPDYPSFDFINIHYFAAAASMFGSEVKGGYEYAELEYAPRNTFPSHGTELSTCVGCHMGESPPHNHTWEPDISRCQECHTGSSFETLSGSPGLNHDQIQLLLADLFQAIRDYASSILGSPLIYDAEAYPYFFHDNGQGAIYPNRYRDFDMLLLRAAYNYQFGLKEPAGFVHNGTYLRQVIYDSILDLDGTVGSDVNVPPGREGYQANSNEFAARTEQYHLSGHGAAGGEPFRHWDEDNPPEVSSSCAKCHTAPGFIEFAMGDPVSTTPAGTLVDCTACHNDRNLYADHDTRYDDPGTNPAIEDVEFPSGEIATLNDASNVCMACHQGRASQQTVDDAIAADPGPYSFINIHYFAAAATFFGKEVNGGYQYRDDSAYRGQNPFAAHSTAPKTCVQCHLRSEKNEHFFMPEVSDCGPCHGNPPTSFPGLSGTPAANHTAIWGSDGLLGDLLTAIQDYAQNKIGKPIFYEPSVYPYFFNSGAPPSYPNRYVDFDAALLKASYNYQVGRKDPGNYVHNGTYTRQLLYDSLDDLDNGAQDDSVSGHTRP